MRYFLENYKQFSDFQILFTENHFCSDGNQLRDFYLSVYVPENVQI